MRQPSPAIYIRHASILLLGLALSQCVSHRGAGPTTAQTWTRPDGERVALRRPSSSNLVDCGSSDPESCECDSDGDCTAQPDGFCYRESREGGDPPADDVIQTCRYPECAVNKDCGVDRLCHPATVSSSPTARCIPASCTTNADCVRAGEQGACRIMSARADRWEAEAHCVYADSVCDWDAKRPCPDRHDQDGVDDACIFVDGVPACARGPEPVP